MKTFKQLLALTILATILLGCKKNEKDELVNEANQQEILVKKIADIIPKEYQDTLTNLGIVINQGIDPPKLDGAFILKTLRLIKSNRKGDVPDMNFADIDIKFFGQDKNNNINFVARASGKSGTTADTSIVTAISGSGKQFTVYGKTKSVSGSNVAIFGVIFSGEVDGNVLRNVRRGIINIDNSKGGTLFIKQGEGRVTRDDDMISESIPTF